MKIIVWPVGEIKEIKLIDPASGVDLAEDFICIYADLIYTNDGTAIMMSGQFDYWSQICNRQSENDNFIFNLPEEERDLFQIILVDALFGVDTLSETLDVISMFVYELKNRRN
jgi:hypothetical protein